MSAAVPVALAALQPAAQPALAEGEHLVNQGLAQLARSCSLAHMRRQAALTCKHVKASCSCQLPVPPNLP